MKFFKKIKNSIFKFIIKRKAKKMLKSLESMRSKRENDFSKVEKDPFNFYYCGRDSKW